MTEVTTPRQALLEVKGLRTAFPGEDGPVVLVDRVSLSVHAGETLAVVGESGSGKTMTFLSVLGLVPRPGRVVAGEVRFGGVDLVQLAPAELRAIRGAGVAMVFQDPLTALNPVFTIGDQLVEVIRAHRPLRAAAARKLAIETLERVHIPDPSRRVDDFPHQLSGGMRQRVLIAMAIALGPKVLVADEPTTALDVTVQAQILELLAELRAELGMGMVLITHDLGLVAKHAERVAVMYAGRVVETCRVEDGFADARHPYTRSLLGSIPRLDGPPGEALPAIEGMPPNLAALPPGCPFEPRCFLGRGRETCRASRPGLAATDREGHASACHHWSELAEDAA
ncbi:MAG: ABC transporter ATP-binding protein [Ectothiorhodospiraceae bacterium]|nr:ABC transporter ATP-binding protein [Planctomycetota bacterium]MCP5151766.1 ABC transporter ATP-binding protein [Chromatiales bacterium]MCP5154297.1 ABC transporter ATP-binding protein [Ectothiorhodospiraceae bacterium]